MAQRVLELQDADGSYGQDPLATACAAAALGQLERAMTGDADPAVPAARHRALAALAAMQADDGLMRFAADRTWQERALVGAFILCLLAGDSDFRETVRFADMMDWFEQHRNELDQATEEYWLMARPDSAAGHTPGPRCPAQRALAA
jgi:hypothetical protein